MYTGSLRLFFSKAIQAFIQVRQPKSPVVVDTITTRFLLLFLFLLAIPLITVIIFTTSLLASHMDEAANDQLTLSKNLMESALSNTAEKLFDATDIGNICVRNQAGLCLGIDHARQSGSLLPGPGQSITHFQQNMPDLLPLFQQRRNQSPFFARIQNHIYLLSQSGGNQPANTSLFLGAPLDATFLNRIYRQQPNLQTQIWVLETSDTAPQPLLIASSPKLAYYVPAPEILATLQNLDIPNELPATVEVNKTQYRLLRTNLYSLEHRKIGQVVHLLPLTQTQLLLGKYYLGIYVIAVASLIFSVLLAMMAGRTITQPLLKLINQVNTLSRENVNKDQDEVAVTGVYEIKQLGEAFNRMIKRLRQEHKMKDEFVATLTHDLKVPLLAEKQTLSYFIKQAYGPVSSEQAEVLDILQSSNRSCLSLVNGLLEVYRYDSGEVALMFESFNLSNLMSETVGELLSLAQEKSIALEIDDTTATLGDEAIVYADRLEIKRVLHNLISNAIINTPIHGSIQCKIAGEAYYGNDTLYKVSSFQYTTLKYPLKLTDRLLVTVQDSGIGFSNDDLSSLFKQFAASKGRNPMSIGLGLYNCHQVLQAHNGTLWVESTEGEGSMVSFVLPQNKQAAQDRRLFRDRRRHA